MIISLMEVSLSPMEARKSPRKTVMGRTSRDNVVELGGVEFTLETEKKKVPRSKLWKKKVVVDDDEEDEVKLSSFKSMKRLSGNFGTDDDEEREKLPVLRKKGKVSVQESDHLDGVDRLSDGVAGFETQGSWDDDDVEMLKEEGEDGRLAVSQDDEMVLTLLSAFRKQDTDEGDLETQEEERRIKPRVASSLPIVFGEKVNKTKVLLECEGGAVDLSGDMGAVGRFTVDRRDDDDELLLDLKGIIYKTTIVPSNTFFVVNVGQTEAKVEAIMSDFVQLRADTNCNGNETMVEGTSQGFAFDSDDERERPAVDGIEKLKHEEGADDVKETKKKNLPAKSPKNGKVPAKKVVAGKSKVGGNAKVGGKS